MSLLEKTTGKNCALAAGGQRTALELSLEDEEWDSEAVESDNSAGKFEGGTARELTGSGGDSRQRSEESRDLHDFVPIFFHGEVQKWISSTK